jgi:hypothetical protein
MVLVLRALPGNILLWYHMYLERVYQQVPVEDMYRTYESTQNVCTRKGWP